MATTQPHSRTPHHHMVFTIPRTASHLLLKLLNLPEQSSVHRHSNDLDGYIFLPAATPRFRYSLLGKSTQDWSEEEKSALMNAFRVSFDDWLRLIDEAERQGKDTFAKEHLHWMVDPLAEARLYGYQNSILPSGTEFQVDWTPVKKPDAKNEYNITCLPDSFLLQRIKPTFLIRHPALTFPSCLRAAIDCQSISTAIQEDKIQQWECTFHWSLSLYKFYSEAAAEFDRKSLVDGVDYPIVIDAQDLGDEMLVKKYARAVGLDEEKARFAWKAASDEEVSGLGKMEKRMKSTILASRGIEKVKLDAQDLDLERLRDDWKDEFGELLSERLVKLVNDSMDAYETLKAVRLRYEMS